MFIVPTGTGASVAFVASPYSQQVKVSFGDESVFARIYNKPPYVRGDDGNAVGVSESLTEALGVRLRSTLQLELV